VASEQSVKADATVTVRASTSRLTWLAWCLETTDDCDGVVAETGAAADMAGDAGDDSAGAATDGGGAAGAGLVLRAAGGAGNEDADGAGNEGTGGGADDNGAGLARRAAEGMGKAAADGGAADSVADDLVGTAAATDGVTSSADYAAVGSRRPHRLFRKASMVLDSDGCGGKRAGTEGDKARADATVGSGGTTAGSEDGASRVARASAITCEVDDARARVARASAILSRDAASAGDSGDGRGGGGGCADDEITWTTVGVGLHWHVAQRGGKLVSKL